MNLSISDSEREFLLGLLDARHTSMLHELHHTDTNDYKQLLLQQIELLEKLKNKLKDAVSAGTTG